MRADFQGRVRVMVKESMGRAVWEGTVKVR